MTYKHAFYMLLTFINVAIVSVIVVYRPTPALRHSVETISFRTTPIGLHWEKRSEILGNDYELVVNNDGLVIAEFSDYGDGKISLHCNLQDCFIYGVYDSPEHAALAAELAVAGRMYKVN